MIKIYLLYIREYIGRRRSSRLAGLAAFTVACVAVFMLMLPMYVDLPLLLGVCMLVRRGGAGGVFACSCAVLAVLSASAVVYESVVPYADFRTYPDPDERYLAEGPLHGFVPNVDVEYPMPYGDLAQKPGFPGSLRSGRLVRFKTDRFGFRNASDYSGERLILVGDGFISGSGNDQGEAMGSALRRLHGVDSYTLAAPGPVQQRLDSALEFQELTRSKSEIALFVFEGADFEGKELVVGILPNLHKLVTYKYYRAKQHLSELLERRAGIRMFTALLSLVAEFDAELYQAHNPYIVISRIGNRRVAFSAAHVDMANCERLIFQLPEPHLQVLKYVKAVYFIPTKYRVYYPMLTDAPVIGPRDPAPGVKALEKYFLPKGIPVHDLTPTLRQHAMDRLREGELVYWVDDTHWNAAGALAAAAFVSATLSGGPAND